MGRLTVDRRGRRRRHSRRPVSALLPDKPSDCGSGRAPDDRSASRPVGIAAGSEIPDDLMPHRRTSRATNTFGAAQAGVKRTSDGE